jgi:hypothetical protein
MVKLNVEKSIAWKIQGNTRVPGRTQETLPTNQFIWTSSIVCHDIKTETRSARNLSPAFPQKWTQSARNTKRFAQQTDVQTKISPGYAIGFGTQR